MRFSTTIRLFLLLVCAVILADWIWARLDNPGEDKPVMWRIETADVATLELRHASGAARRYVRTDDGWSQGDANRVDAALLLLAAPEAARRLPEAGADPATYGFERPALTIDVTEPDRPPVTIEVGDATPDGGNRYVRRAGGEAIFLVPRSWYQAMMVLLPEAKAAGG